MGTQTYNPLIIQTGKSLISNNEFNNNIFKSSDVSLNNESNKSNEEGNNNQLVNLDINANFIDIVKTLNPINKNDIKIVKVIGDGNCLYRCISFFLLGNEQFFSDIKNEIISWIEKNRELFNDFFGDDDINNKTKEELAEEEYKYIKSKDSWGGFHTIEIACIIFGISIGVYTDNGNNEFVRYSFSENLKRDAKLMLLSYHNNNHFDLIYDKSFNLESSKQIQKIKVLKIENKISKLNIKYQGNLFNNNYVKTKFKGSENLYDEISDFLRSKQKYETEINIAKKNQLNCMKTKY